MVGCTSVTGLKLRVTQHAELRDAVVPCGIRTESEASLLDGRKPAWVGSLDSLGTPVRDNMPPAIAAVSQGRVRNL